MAIKCRREKCYVEGYDATSQIHLARLGKFLNYLISLAEIPDMSCNMQRRSYRVRGTLYKAHPKYGPSRFQLFSNIS